MAGLYWHFVDIVWIFLFPLLYLVERHTTSVRCLDTFPRVSLYITIFVRADGADAVTVGAAFVNLGQFNFPVALVIAELQGDAGHLYFMHVKYSSRLTKLIVATGLFFLSILLGETMMDYASRGMVPIAAAVAVGHDLRAAADQRTAISSGPPRYSRTCRGALPRSRPSAAAACRVEQGTACRRPR